MSTATAGTAAITVDSATTAGAMPPRRLARLTGALYLLLVGLGMAGPLTLESLLTPGDASTTAANVAGASSWFTLSIGAWVVIVAVDVVISMTLFLLLEPLGRGLSLTAAAFRLVYSIVVAALLVELFTAHRLLVLPGGATADAGPAREALGALRTFGDGFLVALVFFGMHLLLLGWALARSGYVPRILSLFVVAAGAGYIVDSLGSLLLDGYGGAVSAVALTPTLIGEIGLTLWFLIRGVSSGRRPRRPLGNG